MTSLLARQIQCSVLVQFLRPTESLSVSSSWMTYKQVWPHVGEHNVQTVEAVSVRGTFELADCPQTRLCLWKHTLLNSGLGWRRTWQQRCVKAHSWSLRLHVTIQTQLNIISSQIINACQLKEAGPTKDSTEAEHGGKSFPTSAVDIDSSTHDSYKELPWNAERSQFQSQ